MKENIFALCLPPDAIALPFQGGWVTRVAVTQGGGCALHSVVTLAALADLRSPFRPKTAISSSLSPQAV
ncbi:MAG: hypothetical protein FWD31_00925 [Planctomycetaceae bacterium]|nr:hypothetical protein [Planctomycetaceae bacterium]